MQLPTDDAVDEKMVSLVTNSVSNSIKAQKLICMDKTLTQFRAIIQNINVSEPSPPSSPDPPTPVPPSSPNPPTKTKVPIKKTTLPPSRNSVGGRGSSGGRKAGRGMSVSTSQKRTTSKTKIGIVAIDSDHEDSDVVVISTNESLSPPIPPIVASEVTSRSVVEKRSIGSSCAVVLTSPAKRSTIKCSTEEERSSGAKVSNESDINVLKTNIYLFNCFFALCDVMFKIFCIWYLF